MASRTPYICLNCRFSSRFSLPARRPFTSSSICREVIRPATAPKPTPEVKHIRQHADLYVQNCLDRNYPSHAEYPPRIQQLSDESRRLDQDLRAPRSRIKQLEQTIAKLARQNAQQQPEAGTGSNEELARLRSEAQQLKDESQAMTSRKSTCADEIYRLALSLPNLSSSDTPVGHDPRLVNYLNFDPENPPEWAARPDPAGRSHVNIGTSLSLLDFTSSSTSTGWGCVARRHGWKPVSPPSIVYSYIAEACGFQPRDQHNEQQIWTIEQSDKDKSKPPRSLAGTAEIPLAAMYAGRDIPAAELPIKLVGASRCYRAEAGSRGVDTKGLYRVHEFTKVELFGWSDAPESAAESGNSDSDALFSSLLAIQTEILSSLNLPCRVLEMPSTDLGASASRKQDIEVLFPSRLRLDNAPACGNLADSPAWGEVTSASVCTDYQSRRLGTRVRGGASKESRFPHTVNGTAMAVPRVLAAILETGFDPGSGGVVVPPVLRSWMDGLEVIGKK
ncbi:seryl-trna synthetase [Aspergillus sp. HF37]|nr:seryl-trna synthetase [Aspergillus sp. HF37]